MFATLPYDSLQPFGTVKESKLNIRFSAADYSTFSKCQALETLMIRHCRAISKYPVFSVCSD